MPLDELGDPDSRVIAVPERMVATCPRHGIIATVTLNREQSSAWHVQCALCGAVCTLERA